jgi:hypothetical protein
MLHPREESKAQKTEKPCCMINIWNCLNEYKYWHSKAYCKYISPSAAVLKEERYATVTELQKPSTEAKKPCPLDITAHSTIPWLPS